ncbi:MAG: ribosome biogenesis GTPase Der [Rhodospirillales bacterium]|nr:ribosome biogenesis GTPase Der [Rhodospirillales bacterium]MCB9964809.1 ribosome biogenesis GTPase Der [Rhodospirillales bacterium]MCB9980484.1 ribosome biogenesis GTPase Der [Rhodospirillales bacterium]
MSLTIAIVGRPNVGKSTLFNRIARKKLAIIDDTPGVTRDWRTSPAEIAGYPVTIIDTAGLEERFDESIESRMRKSTEQALAQADVIVFMIDGRAGVTPLDDHFADWLRRQNKPAILVVNKCENEKATMAGVAEAHALGLGEPIPISAEHSDGLGELYTALMEQFPEHFEETPEHDPDQKNFIPDAEIDALEGTERDILEELPEEEEKSIKIAIVGRPNAGKSTLLNALLHDERVMTGPEAGLTRDAIAVDWSYQDRRIRLVDTAGLRRKTKVQNKIERMAVEDTMRAIRLAHIVILMIDSVNGFDKQDLQIAAHIIEEGRGLILACNKWDAVSKKDETRQAVLDRLEKSFSQIHGLPMLTLSALNGQNTTKLMDMVLETYDLWNARVRTAKLNQWLGWMESKHPPPLVEGKPNRLRYITQIKARPPTFVLWCGRPKAIPDSYRRYLINGLRESFEMEGVPIRLLIRTSKNPYV